MIAIIMMLLPGALPHYSVTVDPCQLEYLYAHYLEDMEIPATVCFDTLSSEGTLAFRGGASQYVPKKSWHIRLNGSEPFPSGDHILLNAQFRDPSLMRNSLGMMLTRELGYPAPETEFVTLSINGSNMGVYERVERIDRLFYQRNGFGFGPLFKSIDTLGRLVCQYTDKTGTYSFEPKIDSEPYTNQLVQLIEDCFRNDPSSMETEEFIALFAVNTAIADKDGTIKNIYLHYWQNRWHVYPWDRDASFGNIWTGEYIPGWAEEHSLSDLGYFGGTRPLLESFENVQLLNSLIAASAEIMENEYPAKIESLRILLRDELTQDPYYQYSSLQFDSICTVLSNDIQTRASYLSEVYMADPVSSVIDFEISSCLNMENQLEFEIELEGGNPQGVALLLSIDGADEEWHYMQEGDDGEFSYTLNVTAGTYSVRAAFGPMVAPCMFPVFYPSWSLWHYCDRPVPAPGARVSLAPLSPNHFSPGTPVWCGENLWILPVTSTADHTQDLSLCSFRIGNPSGTVFFPESILVGNGETFYLTNNAGLAEDFCTGQVFGDAGTSYPVNTQLTLNDPSWHEMHSWNTGSGDSLFLPDAGIIPSEVCRGNGNDWIELFNAGQEAVDLSGWYLMDSRQNTSILPDGLVLSSGRYLVACDDPSEDFPGVEPVLLDFSFDSGKDSVFLFTSLGDSVFMLGWNETWPGMETGIMYLNSPLAPLSSPYSWTGTDPPGTPGTPNPGWAASPSYTRIRLASQNPCSGSFSFFYETSSFPVEAILYDMCGRVISRLDLPPAPQGTVTADFSGSLPSGVYIVYLRSSTGSDSIRLTVLQED